MDIVIFRLHKLYVLLQYLACMDNIAKHHIKKNMVCVPAVLILVYAYIMSRGIVRASEKVHDNMLNSVLKSPMSYFDTTPVGRITNRFSHDVDVIDNHMPSCLEFWLDCVYNVVIGLLVTVYTTTGTLVVLIPLFYYYLDLRVRRTPGIIA